MSTKDRLRPEGIRSPGLGGLALPARLIIASVLLVCAPSAAGAEVRAARYHSRLYGRELAILVYTPPGYGTSGLRYPVVYHLLGRENTLVQQSRITVRVLEDAIRRGQVHPVLSVYASLPSGCLARVGHASECAQAAQSLVRELIPYVEATYRTIASREGRAVAGFGEGACAALQLAFEHPYLFGAVAAYAPVGLEVPAPSGNSKGLQETEELLRAPSPWELAENNAEAIREYTAVRLVAGERDRQSLGPALRFRERCEKLKIPLAWHAVSGVGHDFGRLYARAGVETLCWMQSRLAPPGTDREGLVQDVWYWSDVHQRYVWVKVYTPPGYGTGADRYPAVYNLHGGGGTPERQWQRTAQTIRKAFVSGAVRPMIYVFVNGLGDTFFMDLADGRRRAETTIIRELIPFIEQRYRVIPSPQGRAIEGFSMGGAGALRLALKYPELFSAVVSYGAALVRGDRFREQPSRLFSPEYFDQHSAWTLAAENAQRIRGLLRIRMVCGEQDRLYPLNVEFREFLEKLGIAVDWVSVPGVAHDTRGLYRRVGMESLIFIQQSFTQP